MFQQLRKYVVVSVCCAACVLVATSTALAEDLALQNEYVLSSISPIQAVREKAVEALSDAADVTFAQKGVSGGVVLVADALDDDAGDVESQEKDAISESDACAKLRRAQRRQRFENASSNVFRIVRRVVCDPNGLLSVAALPNDPLFSSLWGMNQANDVDVNAPEAWDGGADCSSQVVAVLDTGIQYSHPDLQGNMWTNPGEVPGDGVDNDGNGVVDDVYGFNAVSGATAPGDPRDDHGHGTHCAGTIGAVGNNGVGVAGICHRIKLMAVKFLTSSGSGSLYDAVRALQYVTAAKQRGVNVVLSSNSWSGTAYYSALYAAVADAQAAGILAVAAAGNDNVNIDIQPRYPAAFALDNVITVAAIDSNGNRASFSNYGATSVDIAAPGVSILSTFPTSSYSSLSGTSMATPLISGVVALVKSRYPSWSAAELKSALLRPETRKSYSTLNGLMQSPGIPNVVSLVAAGSLPRTPTPYPSAIATLAPTPSPRPSPTPLPTATPTATPTPGFYNIVGRVSDSNGNSLATATVQLSCASGSAQTLVTGPNGEYAFSRVLGPVKYDLSVSKGGYVFSPVRAAYLTASVTHNFESVPSSVLVSAKVVHGATGAPLSQVVVRLGDAQAVTNAEGLVSFSVPYGSSYSMTVELPLGRTYATERTVSGVVYGPLQRLFVLF